MAKKIIIIGGVAGGASCAARLRRLNEQDQIIMIERGPYISFANCGLPYHMSGAIADRDSLIVTTVEDFKQKFNVDTRNFTEALTIDKKNKKITLKNLVSNTITEESYDILVLSPGAEPILPSIEGHHLPEVFVLRNIPDLDKIMNSLTHKKIKHVSIVGAGFIGLEVAENLRERGLNVTLIEKAPQVMPLMDPEMSSFIEKEFTQRGVEVVTDAEVIKIETLNELNLVLKKSDQSTFSISTQMVLFAIGVRAEIKLAKEAGLEIGTLGGIKVDHSLRTSDNNIFAIGDAIETFDRKSGATVRLPLAGPANRQGRIVADIIQGRKVQYNGTIGTSIVKLFSLTAASVGLNEKTALHAKLNYKTAWVESKSHASYYPGSEAVMLKIIFSAEDGKILGAQAIGKKGIDKRIDVLATAIFANLTVFDLEDLDLAYAPPYSSAKDPINMAGMVASGVLRGDHFAADFHEYILERNKNPNSVVLLDVREKEEFIFESIPGAISMPLSTLRENLKNLNSEKKYFIFCQAGYRGYLASRILIQNNFNVKNILGGFNLWKTSFSLKKKITT